MKRKVVISMSGGLDSTMLAMYWLGQGYEVKAYAFDYGQKHDIELTKLKRNIKFLQKKELPIQLQVINLRDCFSDSASSLHKKGGNIHCISSTTAFQNFFCPNCSQRMTQIVKQLIHIVYISGFVVIIFP